MKVVSTGARVLVGTASPRVPSRPLGKLTEGLTLGQTCGTRVSWCPSELLRVFPPHSLAQPVYLRSLRSSNV